MLKDEVRLSPEIKEALTIWFQLANEAGYNPGSNLMCNIDHSSLLHRLLNGGPVFKKAPPTAYSYPWVDLIKHGKDNVRAFRRNLRTDCSFNPGPWLHLEQNLWKIIEEGENWYVAENGAWRVRAETRDILLSDCSNWAPHVSEEQKKESIRQDNELMCLVEVTLLNPLCDRETIEPGRYY